MTFWVATALLYPRLRDLIGWFVDSVLLHRPDYTLLRARIGQRAQRQQDIAALLDEACAELAPALSARVVGWRELAASTSAEAARDIPARGAAFVDVPVAEPPHYAIEVAELVGGRRLLSDDHAALDAIASLIGRRIDAIRLTNERYARERREQEIGKLATEAELRALRAQINPHFLFNALTTIGFLIQTAPTRALETLMRLTALLRSVLRSEGEFTTLGRELELVEAYLDIEHARFEQRLRVRIDVPQVLRNIRVPPAAAATHRGERRQTRHRADATRRRRDGDGANRHRGTADARPGGQGHWRRRHATPVGSRARRRRRLEQHRAAPGVPVRRSRRRCR